MKVRSSFPLARSQSFSVLSVTPRERGSAVRGNGDAGHQSECPVKVRSSFPLARSQSFSVRVTSSPRARFGRPGQWRRCSPHRSAR